MEGRGQDGGRSGRFVERSARGPSTIQQLSVPVGSRPPLEACGVHPGTEGGPVDDQKKKDHRQEAADSSAGSADRRSPLRGGFIGRFCRSAQPSVRTLTQRRNVAEQGRLLPVGWKR
ncbi:hypothetical protein NDU88_002116 [Pleurodeles waltl]|uniref:Uncharacterized protein n=1 Tax=Pleurodeles waltl TaxID=8319 RepID=A0AAV7NG70_PLEWA|nr:hypothetical protein NDU88_002116 [Pleurodeles waltl]